jgi:hypothetical protein
VEGDQRLEVGERGLGPFVAVDGRLSEAVVTASGGDVVDGLLEPVAAEEPLEGAQRMTGAGVVSCGKEGLDRRFDECGGVERLLVTATRTRLVTATAVVPDQLQARTVDADLASVPVERALALAQHLRVAEPAG